MTYRQLYSCVNCGVLIIAPPKPSKCPACEYHNPWERLDMEVFDG